MTWADHYYARPALSQPCPRHLFVEMARRGCDVIALCNACRERIEIPTSEFDELFANGLAVGKPIRL